MADLNINLNGLELKNPVLTASGTFGYGLEFQDFIQLDKLGGFIVKGTTLKHREGNSYPRMAETPSGMLNAVGLQNKGVDYFIERIYPEIKDIETNILVNERLGSHPCHRIEYFLSQCKGRWNGFRYQLCFCCRSRKSSQTGIQKAFDGKIIPQCDQYTGNSFGCRK